MALTLKKLHMFKKIISIILLIFFYQPSANAQNVKNVILLIPDGASTDLLALSRWYSGTNKLAIDELICGMVKTHSADSTIADSAPTGTAMATGHKSITKYIGVDANRTPRISILEQAKLRGMATGVVVTCQFPHATPAAFVCHHVNRDDYPILSKQFISNSPTLVFGGGKKYIDENNLEPFLNNEGITIISNLNDFRALQEIRNNQPVWALFSDWNSKSKYLSYSCDRNENHEPSLAEMTHKAIQILSKSGNGFFLMVEGSQIDWAAHVNDPKAIVTEFLAFNESVAVALEFAKQNGETVVIVCPDHGNGGISIGNMESGDQSSNPNKYDKVNVHKRVVEPLLRVTRSSRWVVETILNELESNKLTLNPNKIDTLIANNYSVNLSDNELHSLINSLEWYRTNVKTNSKAASDTLSKAQVLLGRKLSQKLFIGWTTTGHTSEDVFLGVYHPQNDRPFGVVDNTEIAIYIQRILGLNVGTNNIKEQFYCLLPTDSFPGWDRVSSNPLVFKTRGKSLEIPYNTNYYFLNGKKRYQSVLTIAIDEKVYVSSEVYKLLQNQR